MLKFLDLNNLRFSRYYSHNCVIFYTVSTPTSRLAKLNSFKQDTFDRILFTTNTLEG